MRTFTVVPSFEGNSAHFELPDIGFQGDHLSFAILFNLTELTEHWPDIVPSMIVTDSKNNTYLAPYTSWDPITHIYTWSISSTETTYEGTLMCQLKCSLVGDPETIVCMSQICQTRVYPSLAAAENPPEAFQTWLDTLAQLEAEIQDSAAAVHRDAASAETNARTAVAAADDAIAAKQAVEAAEEDIEYAVSEAAEAAETATSAASRARASATSAAASAASAAATQSTIEDDMLIISAQVNAAQSAANTATTQAGYAQNYSLNADHARDEAVIAKNAAVAAKGDAITAKTAAQTAEAAARQAQQGAEAALSSTQDTLTYSRAAQTAAETAQTAAEAAQTAAETAQGAAETSEEEAKKWANGHDLNGDPVVSNDPAYHNNSKYWSEVAAGIVQAVSGLELSTAYYSSADESVTIVLGSGNIANNSGA